MDVSYDSYKIFYYVAKYRSFTGAAKALYAEQPNVTRAVRNLEQALGCRLFVRSNRGAYLTPEGEKLFSHVKIACEQIEAAEEELHSFSLSGGTVSVGTTENGLACVLLPVLKRFRASYPDITVKVTNYNTKQAIAAAEEGAVDFSLVSSPVLSRSALSFTAVTKFRDCAVAGRTFSALSGKTVLPKELSAFPIVSLGRGTATFEFLSDYFRREGLELTPDIETGTIDQILSFVENGLGVGFVPSFFLKRSRNFIRLELDPPLPEREVLLVKPHAPPLSAAAKRLEREILKDC